MARRQTKISNSVRVGAEDAHTRGTAKERLMRDEIVPQLARRIRGGRETWVVHLRQDGKPRKVTLGACTKLTVIQARGMALDLLETPTDALPLSGAMALSKFAGMFLEECAGRWKATTLRSNRQSLRSHILPALGHLDMAQMKRQDVTAWFHHLGLAKGGRNRALSVLSSLFQHAEIRGLRAPGSNPCAGMRRHETSFKATYLDAAGYAALGRAFEAVSEAHPMAVILLRFCALTGCRKFEAMGLNWAMIDGSRAALPDSKSGPKSIWLGAPVRGLLAQLPKTNDVVFVRGGKPLGHGTVNRAWNLIRAHMDMPNLRIHDLRHSFASVAVSEGFDLLRIGGLLGHSDKGSTAGYAHLSKGEIKAASARVGKHFAEVIAKSKTKRRARPMIRSMTSCAVASPWLHSAPSAVST